MATIAVASRVRLNTERKFYTRMAFGLVAVVFLSFVHPATWLGFGLASIAVLVPLFVFGTGVNWAAIAAKLPGVGA